MPENLHAILLIIHSALRWLVLLAAVLAVAVAVAGLVRRLRFKPVGRRFASLFAGLMDLQFLLGLALLFTSPVVRMALADFKTAMKTHDLRFFTVEHTLMMLAALVLAHIGAARSRRAQSDSLAYRRMLVWFVLALGIMTFAIPWWRPLLRGF